VVTTERPGATMVNGGLSIAEQCIDRQVRTELFRGRQIELVTGRENAAPAALRAVLAGHDLRRWMFTDRRRSHRPNVHLAAHERLRPGIPQPQRDPRPFGRSGRNAAACGLFLDLRPDPRPPRLVFQLPAPAWPPGAEAAPGSPPLLRGAMVGQQPLTGSQRQPGRHVRQR
jgi:hypothetical protein